MCVVCTFVLGMSWQFHACLSFSTFIPLGEILFISFFFVVAVVAGAASAATAGDSVDNNNNRRTRTKTILNAFYNPMDSSKINRISHSVQAHFGICHIHKAINRNAKQQWVSETETKTHNIYTKLLEYIYIRRIKKKKTREFNHITSAKHICVALSLHIYTQYSLADEEKKKIRANLFA